MELKKAVRKACENFKVWSDGAVVIKNGNEFEAISGASYLANGNYFGSGKDLVHISDWSDPFNGYDWDDLTDVEQEWMTEALVEYA